MKKLVFVLVTVLSLSAIAGKKKHRPQDVRDAASQLEALSQGGSRADNPDAGMTSGRGNQVLMYLDNTPVTRNEICASFMEESSEGPYLAP